MLLTEQLDRQEKALLYLGRQKNNIQTFRRLKQFAKVRINRGTDVTSSKYFIVVHRKNRVPFPFPRIPVLCKDRVGTMPALTCWEAVPI